MQLKYKNVSKALATASCALLGGTATAQEPPKTGEAWEFDTALLYYTEQDRVTAIEAVFGATKNFGDDRVFTGKVVFDSLTGASASGAVAQPTAQTFTRPSGNGQFTTAAGETPLDDTFRDTRVQINGQWTQPIGKDLRGSGGLVVSREFDYLSIAVNGSVAKDFNKKNTTVSAGLSYAFDSIEPEGGIPLAFASQVTDNGQFANQEAFDAAFDLTRVGADDDRDTIDVLLGLTQVINRRTIMQFNYGLSLVDGYLTDPYKILSVVDASGITQDLLYENRPDDRTKHNFFWQTKHHFKNTIADVSYRYTTDDFEIDSHTIDSRFRIPISSRAYLQPHVRLYQQSAADFYRPFLNQGEALPEFASADYRVGEFTAYTVGLKYGAIRSNGHEWAIRLEYYQQDPKNSGVDLPGVLNDLDIFPSIRAALLQFNYSF